MESFVTEHRSSYRCLTTLEMNATQNSISFGLELCSGPIAAHLSRYGSAECDADCETCTPAPNSRPTTLAIILGRYHVDFDVYLYDFSPTPTPRHARYLEKS